MAANTYPIFSKTGIIGMVQISTANANRDGTGTIGTVTTAGTEGYRIEFIRIHATVTTTAGLIRLFIHDGSNYRLIDEIAVSAITPSGTTAAFKATWTPPQPFVLPNGYSLRASTENAETFNVVAFGGSLTA